MTVCVCVCVLIALPLLMASRGVCTETWLYCPTNNLGATQINILHLIFYGVNTLRSTIYPILFICHGHRVILLLFYSYTMHSISSGPKSIAMHLLRPRFIFSLISRRLCEAEAKSSRMSHRMNLYKLAILVRSPHVYRKVWCVPTVMSFCSTVAQSHCKNLIIPGNIRAYKLDIIYIHNMRRLCHAFMPI